MSEIKEIQCDVEGCKFRNAHTFSLFDERKYNGQDYDDWDFVFDLCPAHEHQCLQAILTNLGRGLAINKQGMLNSLTGAGIVTRRG